MFLKAVLLVTLLSVSAGSALDWSSTLEGGFDGLHNAVGNLKKSVYALGRQMMLQQFFTEDRLRNEGQSGIKLIRLRSSGTKSYHGETHASGGSQLTIHDHSNNVRTVGMGEFVVVMNGVEFRTRHNDYRLYMSHRNSSDYKKTQNVPFPPVPPSVLAKGDNVEAQVTEMVEYFRAFRNQNVTHRDYRPYFKPVLCYLEGAWTRNNGGAIDESFDSDRHFIDASSWHDLQDKIRFTSYTGGKSRLENLAFLPTSVMGFVNNSIPIYTQWNYRILCHPLKRDLPTNRLHQLDDLSTRLNTKRTNFQILRSRLARFAFGPEDSDKYEDKQYQRGLLDELMEEIPGMDNYQGYIEETIKKVEVKNFDNTPKDVSRYHRWFKYKGRNTHRSWSDDFMFAAKSTQPRVAGVNIHRKCYHEKIDGRWQKICPAPYEEKWTWAIPLELIYLNPLYTWNPHKLVNHGEARNAEGKKATLNGRNGDCRSPDKALDGINSINHYMTPSSLFRERGAGSSADTVRGEVCVRTPSGKIVKTKASGTHVFLPSIPGVGALRMRYPIAPVHGQGSPFWKEKDALTELVMDPGKFERYFWYKNSEEDEADFIELEMGNSGRSGQPIHRHTLVITKEESELMKRGFKITKTSDQVEGHAHTVEMEFHRYENYYFYRRCDGTHTCHCRHPKNLTHKNKITE